MRRSPSDPDHPRAPGRHDRDDAVLVVAEEFNALRREIDRRIAPQFQLVFFNFSLVAGDAALVFQLRANVLFLLLIPVLSLMLGLLWLDNTTVIMRIGRYIKTKQWGCLRARMGSPELPSWEDAWQRGHPTGLTAFLAFVPPIGVFAVPAVPAIVFVLIQMDKSAGAWALWSGTVLASAAGTTLAALAASAYK